MKIPKGGAFCSSLMNYMSVGWASILTKSVALVVTDLFFFEYIIGVEWLERKTMTNSSRYSNSRLLKCLFMF